MNKAICFVISPIGEDGSDIRKQADQVIKRIIDAPLVIADLTGMNPNVFYELAIRHCVKKPLIQLMKKGEKLPFDISGLRTVFVDTTDPDSIVDAIKIIVKQIDSEVKKEPQQIFSPIREFILTKEKNLEEWPNEISLSTIIKHLQIELRNEHFENKIAKHTGITKFYKGTVQFAGKLLENIEDNDHLVILDTFIDNVFLVNGNENGKYLFDKLFNILKEKPLFRLSIIAVSCSESARLQMFSRAFLSHEGRDHLDNANKFWSFVTERLLESFPDRVRVREINFLPCVSVFAVEHNNDQPKNLKAPPFFYRDSDICNSNNNSNELHVKLSVTDQPFQGEQSIARLFTAKQLCR